MLGYTIQQNLLTLKNIIMENKELIGKKVKGFEFEIEKSRCFFFTEQMYEYIGKLGTIIHYRKRCNSYTVEFEDGRKWNYPAELIEQHLVEESQEPKCKIGDFIPMITRNSNQGFRNPFENTKVQKSEIKSIPYDNLEKCLDKLFTFVESKIMDFDRKNYIKYIQLINESLIIENELKIK